MENGAGRGLQKYPAYGALQMLGRKDGRVL